MAAYWAGISVTEGESLIESARTLALLGVAQANAGIIAWTAKWFPTDSLAPQPRPVSVINHIAGVDGSDLTIQDPDWLPSTIPHRSLTTFLDTRPLAVLPTRFWNLFSAKTTLSAPLPKRFPV
ncbi:MAG: hypothetical protein HC890_09655 [Chloroflexaceae bacterium]|nr:hypothetical protein [Chloroflexaceae bacterium]